MGAAEFIHEVQNMRRDPSEFLKYCQILTSNGLSTFKPRYWQRKQLREFGHTIHTKQPNHLIVGPRQVGKTAMIAAYILWYALLHDNKCVGLISYKLAAAQEILHTIREMFMYLPKSLQLDKKIWRKDCVQFANNTRIVISNCAMNSVKGRAFDLLVVDEAAHVSDKEFKDFMMSVFPTQACRPDSQMIIITTPKSKHSEFHKLYQHVATHKDTCSFNLTHLKWNCVAGRDTAWKNKMKMYHNYNTFRSEYLAEFIDE